MFDYEKIPLHWVNRLSFLVRKELAQRFRSAGHLVGPEEWAVLLVLWKKGAKTPSAMADVTVKDRTTVTRLIDGMVRKGLVERSEHPEDRRRSVITTSKRGNAIQRELVPIAKTLIAEATQGISAEDIETTNRTLKAMAANILGAPVEVSADQEIENVRL